MYKIGDNSAGDPEVVAEITQRLHDAAAAVGREAQGVAAMFWRDESTILFDYLSPGATTVDDLLTTAQELASAEGVTFSYPRITVRQLADDVALSLADSHLEMRRPDGMRQVVESRVSDIWQRIEGTWLAVHEHASIPIDMETGRAVFTTPATEASYSSADPARPATGRPETFDSQADSDL